MDNKYKSDAAIVETSRRLMQDYVYRCVQYRVLHMDEPDSFEGWAATEPAASVNPHVVAEDVREIGRFDLRLPPGFDTHERRRHWVFVRRDDREITYVLSLKNKTLLEQRGHVDLVAFQETQTQTE